MAQTKNYIDQPYIETTAEADTLVTPDEIYLNILISEKDTKDKQSVEDLELMMEKTLKELGINTAENLQLNDLASNFKKYLLKQKDVLKTKIYTLKVKDAPMAGKVIVKLEQLEIANVTLDHTDYSKMEDLQLILKSNATTRARQQAEFLVKPLNQQLGTAILILDLSNNRPLYEKAAASTKLLIRGYSSMSEAEYKPADISFEKIKVECSVKVIFKLEQ